jgi:DNA polymerase sigma
MDPDDPRHRLSGYPAHGSGQSPSPASQNYVTPSYGNEPRYGTQVGNAGLANPLLFGTAQPQTGPPSQSRPITLQELEKMTLAQRGAANQSVSSQFAGNSLFGGGGDFTQGHGYVGQASQHGQVGQGQHAQQIPVRETQQMIGGGPSMGEFAGQRQGGGQPSLFGDPLSFFQGMATPGGGPARMPAIGMNATNGVSSSGTVSGVNEGLAPALYMSTGPAPNPQVVSQQRQTTQLEQLNKLFSQQTVGGANPGIPGSFTAPSHSPINGSGMLPSNLSMSPMSSISVVSPNIGMGSPLAAISTSAGRPMHDTQLGTRAVTKDTMTANESSVSTPTSTSNSTQQYQKQSREDRWVDIMDHTHTGRKPLTDMTALNKSLLTLAKSLSHNEDDVNSWKQALSYVHGILKTTLGSSLKEVSLFGSSANGLAVHGNNDIDVSAMVDLGDGGLLLGDVTMLREEEIEALEAVIRQKKGDIIAELGLALERDLEARFGNGAGKADGTPRTRDSHAETREPSSAQEPKFNLLVLPNARVPVIKFTYPPTQTQVDITINNTLACLNTKLIACYAALDERVSQLVHIVKHWAKRRHVNDPYTGTLSSYCYVLMCIFHCQTRNPPILPNLQDDRVYPMTIDTVVDSWKVAYLDDITVAKQAFKTQNTQTLASLVWEFFEFWAWKHSYPHDVISIRKGQIVSKASKDWTKRIGRDRHLVCVEDPFVLSHDLGRTVDMRSKDVIRKEFFRAGTVLRDYDDCFELLFEGYTSRPARQRTPGSNSKRGGRGQARRPNQPRGK